ncbi:MAG: CARDB domain-containing protein [Thermoplasmata archaeon]
MVLKGHGKALCLMAALLASCALPAPALRSPGNIDLAVSPQNISLDPGHPGELRTNDNITVRVTVSNLGNEPAYNVSLQILWNTSDEAPKLVGIHDFNESATVIGAGSSAEAIVHWNTSGLGLEPGVNYTIWVTVYNDTHPESQWDSNPSNNRASLNITFLPDVIPVVEELRADRSLAIVGDTVLLTVVLNNTGIRPAVGEPVELFLDNEERPFQTNYTTIPPTTPTNLKYYWNTSGIVDGPHTVTAKVRQSSRSVQLQFKYRTNPFIASISPSVNHATIGESVTINVTLDNNGSEAAQNVRVDFYLDAGGVPIGNRTVAEVPVGVTTNTSFDWDTHHALPGNHTIRARVELTGSECRTGNITLVAPTLPDLTIENVSLSDYSPLIGQVVRVNINVCNIGEGAMEDNTSLKVWLDAQIDPIFETNVTPLGPGQSLLTSFDWDTAGLSPFRHTLFVYVNPEAELEESNATNNDFKMYVNLRGAVDLAIESLALSITANQSNITGEITSGDRVWVWITVLNRGSLSSLSNTTLELFLDDAPVPIFTRSLNPISAGGRSTQYFIWDTSFFNDTADTNHTLKAVVDAGNRNADANPANNRISINFIVHPFVPEADLEIVELNLSKRRVYYEEIVFISVHIANRGGKAASNITLRFMFRKGTSPQPLADQKIASLLPGEHINRSQSWQVLVAPGNYTIEVQLDPTNSVVEQTKENNAASAELEVLAAQVREPRLEIAGFVVQSTRPSAGEKVRVNVTLMNNGTATATYIVITILVNGEPGPSYSVAQLGPGESTTVSLFWTAKRGPHTLRATATARELGTVMGPTVSVTVGAEEEGMAPLDLMIIAVIIVLIVVAAVLMLRGTRGTSLEESEEE